MNEMSMKAENSTESDPALHSALGEWQVRETLPPRFTEQVWQRIAREEAQGPASVWTQLFNGSAAR